LLYSSNLIVAEAAILVAVRSKGNALIMQDFEDLVWGKAKIAKILMVTSDIERDTWNFFKKVNTGFKVKKDFIGLVDISCIELMKKHQIEAIVSFDGHFDRFVTRIS